MCSNTLVQNDQRFMFFVCFNLYNLYIFVYIESLVVVFVVADLAPVWTQGSGTTVMVAMFCRRQIRCVRFWPPQRKAQRVLRSAC